MIDTTRVVDSSRTIMCTTPGLQRIRQNFNIHSKNDEEDPYNFTESLNELLKQTWNIWGVSSLYRFQFNSKVILKQYAKKLREEVASMLPKEDVSYEAKIEILEDITPRPSTSDLPPVQIKIIATSKEQIQQNIYTGIMMSWRTEIVELDYDNSIKLPLILCRGTKSGMNAVHVVLGNMFDCQIVELSATEEDLKWLVPIVLNPASDNSDEKGEAKCEYRTPGSPASDSIVIKFQIKDLIKKWNSIIEDDNDDDQEDNSFQVRHVEKFFKKLHNQMLIVSGLQLDLCSLKKISLPNFTIMDNRMKATSPEVLNRVLLYFNQKSLEMLHPLNFPSIDISSNKI